MARANIGVAVINDLDEHDDLVEWNLLVRLEREHLLKDGLTAYDARKQLNAV